LFGGSERRLKPCPFNAIQERLMRQVWKLETDFMKSDKIRNLTDAELQHQGQDLADQLFKLKFQLNMGQTESLKKIRGLRKDIARVKTILGERSRAAVTEKR
jgi:ribosomal protein L29